MSNYKVLTKNLVLFGWRKKDSNYFIRSRSYSTLLALFTAALCLALLTGSLNFILSSTLQSVVNAPTNYLTKLGDTLNKTENAKLTNGKGIKVLLVGDSTFTQIAPPVADIISKLSPKAEVSSKVEEGTSLSTPELYNWPKELKTTTSETKYDLVVVLLSPNVINKASQVNSKFVPLSSPVWARWANNTINSMVEAADAPVVWLTRPAATSKQLRAMQKIFSDALVSVSTSNSKLVVCQVANSVGSKPVENIKGNMIRIRDPDNIHLTAQGARLYARATYPCFKQVLTPSVPSILNSGK